jgi:isoquinoline 1-oxidoreductase beta subunit
MADFVTDAIQVSQKSKNLLNLMWTREDDMGHDFFRPTSIHKLSATLSNQHELRLGPIDYCAIYL